MTPCPHGMPTPSSCIDCMDDGNLPPAPKPEPETVERFFAHAVFDSHCSACHLPISVGERLAKMSTGRYIHAECVS